METKCGGERRTKVLLIMLFIVLCFLLPSLDALAVPSPGLLRGQTLSSLGANVVDGNDLTYVFVSANTAVWPVYTFPTEVKVDGVYFYASGGTPYLYLVNSAGNSIKFSPNSASGIYRSITPFDVKYIRFQNESSSSTKVFEVDLKPFIAPPSAPNSLFATVLSYNQVQLTWQPNSESDLAGYIIYRNNNEIARVDNNTTSYVDSGLTPGTTYTYGIKAYNTLNVTSDMSNAAPVTTPRPPAPSGLTVSNVTSASARVSWNAVAGAESYNIYLDGTSVSNTTQTQYDITRLAPGTRYAVEVRTVISGIESDPTVESFTTVSPSPPTAPANLKATVTGTTVSLTWDASNVSGYRIYIDGDLAQELPGDHSSYSFTGKRGKTYEVRVEAYNDYGDASSTVTIKIGQLTTPGAATMIGDVAKTIGVVVGSMGGLLALALGIKGSGTLIGILRLIIGR